MLLPQASELTAVDAEFRAKLTPRHIREILALIPEEWLINEGDDLSATGQRGVYVQFLITRLAESERFINAANDARDALV